MKPWIAMIALLAVFVLCTGCGDDDDSTGDGGTEDGGTDTDTGTQGADGSSCELGYPLVVDAPSGMQGAIDPAGDADWFRVEVEAGAFYAFLTSANPNDDPALVDTVISVYADDGTTLLATGDDSVPRVSTDTEIFYRAAETGTLCLKVEEWSTWAAADPEGDPSFTYKILARTLDDTAASNNEDLEPNDNAASAQGLTFAEGTGADWGYVYGTLDPVSDIDVFGFTVPAGTASTYVYFMPSGPGASGENATQGHGSTLALGVIEVVDSDASVIAALDVSLGSDAIGVPVAAGAALTLWVQRLEGTTPGANDFYFLKQFNFAEDNPAETEPNDTAANASPIVFTDGSGYLLGFVDPVTDVDYFAFDATAGETYNVACGAARSGSGLVDATFSVHDPSDAEIQVETETPEADVLWSDTAPDASMPAIDIDTTGTYYLLVTTGSQSPDVTSSFYRCGIHLVTN